MFKCGEEIRVRRGQKKTLRFWSDEDDFLKVELVSSEKTSNENTFSFLHKNRFKLKGNNKNSQTQDGLSSEFINMFRNEAVISIEDVDYDMMTKVYNNEVNTTSQPDSDAFLWCIMYPPDDCFLNFNLCSN